MFDTKGVMSSRVGSGQLSLSLEPERRIFRVSELNAAVQRRFEEEFSGIWVAGEISSCKVAASGHYYFSLKDDKSQLRCALFKGAARFVKFKPVDGLAVIARGKLEVYEARGEYQLIVEALEPQGAGALQIAFEQMKKRLAMEGLFDAARKRALPRLPKRIGIVTSPAGSVIRDMLHVFERRFPGLHVRLYPAQVQGEGALEQVCAGLNYFSNAQWAEVVILARGGGSLEDLWTFNEEAVARAIAASSVPVISAIGHETDFTIADFAADHRAPTPSAAAEIVICTRESLLEQIAALREQAARSLRYRLLHAKQRLQERGTERAEALIQRAIRRRVQRVDESESQLRRSGKSLVDSARRRLDDLRRRLQATDLRLRFARHRHALELLRQRFENAMYDRVRGANRRLEDCQLHLRQLSPLNVLSRGYAIVEDGNGRVLRSSAETALGDRVRVRLHEGRLTAEVTEIEG
jgi:exodeoxyribonuclease VII large subunit